MLEGGDPKKIDVVREFERLKLTQHIRLVGTLSERQTQTDPLVSPEIAILKE